MEAAQANALEIRENKAIYRAMNIIESRLKVKNTQLSSPRSVKTYCSLCLSNEDREVFMVIFLDSQNRLIESEKMFYGTLTQTTVHVREVIRSALKHNAASVIFSHNHPSGVPQPSKADIALTDELIRVLTLLDVKVLDHIVVAGVGAVSFVEEDLL